jgi:general secretion pathway protein G
MKTSAIRIYLSVRRQLKPGRLPICGRSVSRHGVAGFTLIEILVVVTILAILGALVVPKIIDRPNEARVVAARQDIGTLINVLKMYKLDNGRYPTTEQGLKALIERPTSEPIPGNWKNGGYLEKAPKDPWGHDYIYLNPGLRGDIDVMSYGADGQQGGDGYDADIGSWM